MGNSTVLIFCLILEVSLLYWAESKSVDILHPNDEMLKVPGIKDKDLLGRAKLPKIEVNNLDKLGQNLGNLEMPQVKVKNLNILKTPDVKLPSPLQNDINQIKLDIQRKMTDAETQIKAKELQLLLSNVDKNLDEKHIKESLDYINKWFAEKFGAETLGGVEEWIKGDRDDILGWLKENWDEHKDETEELLDGLADQWGLDKKERKKIGKLLKNEWADAVDDVKDLLKRHNKDAEKTKNKESVHETIKDESSENDEI